MIPKGIAEKYKVIPVGLYLEGGTKKLKEQRDKEKDKKTEK